MTRARSWPCSRRSCRVEGGHDLRRSRVRRRDVGDGPAQASVDAEPRALLEAWIAGASVDWSRLHEGRAPRRLALPTYPFEANRHWFRDASPGTPAPASPDAPAPAKPPVVSLPPLTSFTAESPAVRASHVPADVTRSLSVLPATAQPAHVTPEPATVRPAAPAKPSADAVAEILAELLAEVLYMDIDEVALAEPFVDMGLDSVIGVEWIHAVNQRFGVKIPATRVYDHPNILAFAEYIVGLSQPQAEASAALGAEPPSLDDVLERVRRGELDIEAAEQLIERFGLLDARGGSRP